MAKAAGRNLHLGICLAASLLILAGTFAAGPTLSFWFRMGSNALGLLILAASLFLTIGASRDSGSRNPSLRAAEAVVLALGGVAVLIMLPFLALAFSALIDWANP